MKKAFIDVYKKIDEYLKGKGKPFLLLAEKESERIIKTCNEKLLDKHSNEKQVYTLTLFLREKPLIVKVRSNDESFIINKMDNFYEAVTPDDSGNKIMALVPKDYKNLNFKINEDSLDLRKEEKVIGWMKDLESKTIKKFKEITKTERFLFVNKSRDNRISFLHGAKDYKTMGYELSARLLNNKKEQVLFSKKSRDPEDYKTVDLLVNDVEKDISSELGKKIIFGKEYPLYFTGKGAGKFLRFILELIINDNMKFFPKEQVKYFSEKLTLYDDPTLSGGWFTRPFDDCGINTSQSVFIEKGYVVKPSPCLWENGELTNRPGAYTRLKDDVYYYSPSNAVIDKGDTEEYEIIEYLNPGIMVTDILDVFIEKDNILVVRAKGDYYINGEKLHSVGNLIIKDKMDKIFKSIVEITGKEVVCEGYEGYSFLLDSIYAFSYS